MITINIDPVAFTIGTLEVRWYGIFVALAVAVVVFWTAMQVRRGAHITYDTVFTAALIGIPSGIVVSRLLHIIDRWDYFVQNPAQIIGAEGLTIYGAVLGAALGVWIYSKFSRFQFGYVADLIAPGIILAQAVGRIGCILNGCCFGAETTLPWGIVYTHPGSVCPVGVVVQPTQFYEIIYNLLVFGVLLKLRGHLKPDGSLFAIYLALYSVWRVGIGFLREGTPFLFSLHQAQIIGIIILLIVVPWLILKAKYV